MKDIDLLEKELLEFATSFNLTVTDENSSFDHHLELSEYLLILDITEQLIGLLKLDDILQSINIKATQKGPLDKIEELAFVMNNQK